VDRFVLVFHDQSIALCCPSCVAADMEAVVVGWSNIVGKPVAQLLLREDCTVTIAHSRTRDLPSVVRRADLVIAAQGLPGRRMALSYANARRPLAATADEQHSAAPSSGNGPHLSTLKGTC
jgi:hypothetical protein